MRIFKKTFRHTLCKNRKSR